MRKAHQIHPRAIVRLAVALALTGCSSLGASPPTNAPGAGAQALVGPVHRSSSTSTDLYIGNILGGVLLYSTGKKPQQVGDITDQLPRVTGVWVDQKGVLYAFSDNRSEPYETIEEFEPGATSPFFSLAVKRYGGIVAADAEQNVYSQGENSSSQQVVDVYPPGSQEYSHEYVVPSIGRLGGVEGLAFDSTGALLVGVAALANNKQGQIGAVFRLSSSSGTFENLNLQKDYGGVIATDTAGNLYVGGGKLISVYAPGATTAFRVIHNKDQVVTLAVATDGTLYANTYRNGILVYPHGRKHAVRTIDPQAEVSSLALGPG